MLPTGVVKHRNMVAGNQTQYSPQVRQFLTVQDAAIAAQVCSRHEKTRHGAASLSLQEQRHPFARPLAFEDSEARGEPAGDGARFPMQDSGQNEKSFRYNFFFQIGAKLHDRLRGQVGQHHVKLASDPVWLGVAQMNALCDSVGADIFSRDSQRDGIIVDGPDLPGAQARRGNRQNAGTGADVERGKTLTIEPCGNNLEEFHAAPRGGVGPGAKRHARLDGDHLAAAKLWRRQPGRRHPQTLAYSPRFDESLPGVLPICLLDDFPLQPRLLRARRKPGDGIDEASDVPAQRRSGERPGKKRLQAIIFENHTRRAALDQKIRERIDVCSAGADRKLRPRLCHEFLCHRRKIRSIRSLGSKSPFLNCLPFAPMQRNSD